MLSVEVQTKDCEAIREIFHGPPARLSVQPAISKTKYYNDQMLSRFDLRWKNHRLSYLIQVDMKDLKNAIVGNTVLHDGKPVLEGGSRAMLCHEDSSSPSGLRCTEQQRKICATGQAVAPVPFSGLVFEIVWYLPRTYVLESINSSLLQPGYSPPHLISSLQPKTSYSNECSGLPKQRALDGQSNKLCRSSWTI